MYVFNAFVSLLLAGLLAAPSSGTSIDWTQVDALLRDQVSSGAFPAAVAMIANADGTYRLRDKKSKAAIVKSERYETKGDREQGQKKRQRHLLFFFSL
jgi:hypothetical protein